MAKDREGAKGSRGMPTGSREDVQAGDLAPEGLRGARPDLESEGPGRVAPRPDAVASGGVPSAHPMGAPDAPGGDETI